MNRGLPYSLALHSLALVIFFLYGSTIARAPLETPKSIKVRMVHMPPAQPPKVEVAEQPVVAQPLPKEVLTDLPPKELPKLPAETKKPIEKPKDDPVVQEKKVEPDPDPLPDEETETKSVVTAPPVALGPSVESTDSDFPFAWYRDRMKSLIDRNWSPRQLGFGKNALVSCAVHFQVGRDGTVSQVTMVRNSGIGVYDRETIRAVQTTHMPPLPAGYTGSSLGVTFIFNLEPGS